jgi:beta-lactamase regulating signal transducer with metallopeptidase domain
MMLTSLVRASMEGTALVAATWIVGRLWPRLSARTLAILWWCAAAKFLLALVWVTPIELRILPAPRTDPVAALTVASQPSRVDSIPATALLSSDQSARTGAGVEWRPVLLGLWIGGVALAMVVSIRRWQFTADLVERSEPAPEDITRIATEIAAVIGLKRPPPVRISNDVGTPFVAGALRPVVVVPTDPFAALSADEKRMALCHELAHVKRADLWLGCVPALAERLFFFHPLVRLSAREYAVCREAACDAAVIDALETSPREYGRLLLALGVTPGRMAVAAAGAPWSFSTLKRRITMLREPSTHSWQGRAIAGAVVAVAVAAIVPLRLGARPQISVEHAGLPRDRTPLELLTTLAKDSEQPGQRESKERKINYVLFLDDHHTNVSGSMRDIEVAGRHRRNAERMLWFRQAGKEYVVRDPSVIDQVLNLWVPVNVIGDQQGKVGARQGELGARQGEIGERQGRIGAEQGKIGAKQGEIGDRQGRLAAREISARTDAERRSIDAERQRLDEEMRTLDRQMREVDAKMRDLDKPMGDLDQQMRVLDREMQALDTKMQAAVKQAETEMQALMDQSIASGVAVPVK